MRGRPSSIDAAKKLALDGAALHGRGWCNCVWNCDKQAIELQGIS